MIDKILDILKDCAIDTLKVMPFLLLVYLLIEFIEHRHSDKLSGALKKSGVFGAVGGSLLGCIPQCGFSAAASNLYAGRLISVGTLIAVFISTSDEAIPMLLAEPKSAGVLWKLILIKIVIAAATGIIVDILIKLFSKKQDEQPHFEELCKSCDCEHHGIFKSALIHTVQISLFIFAVNLILGSAIEFLGAENISKIFMENSPLQPFITSLFGFIPNCASSVIVTQLYIEGVISFGSCVAGLCTGAGVGLVVLFRTNRNVKENLLIMAAMYASACISGLIINLF
ncbi:MAG: putative manganese transporter [Oscillospiraceae bacterium]